MAREDNIFKDIISAIKDAQKPKTTAYDTIATVTRIEGDVAWCHIPGGIDETPIRMTVNAEKGDTVQVRVSNGRAFLVGNATAPPTDDKKANAAQKTANSARSTAELAKKAIEKQQEFFWHDKNGAHVIGRSYRTDIKSDGMHIIDTNTGEEIALFGASRINIGTGDNNIVLDPDPDATVAMKIGTAMDVDPDGNMTLKGNLETNDGEIQVGVYENEQGIERTELFLGRSADLTALSETIDETTGEVTDSRHKVVLRMSGNTLGDVYLNIPADVASFLGIVNFYGRANFDKIYANSVYVGDHASAIGNTVSGNATVNLVSGTTMTKLAELRTLGAGTWIINAGVRFTGNATGTRAIQIYVNGSGDGPGFASGNVAGSGLFSLECSSIASSNSDMPIALYARQNSGATMSVTYYWSAVRIA